MKNQELQFSVSAGLKNLIGRELITDDFIAIFELVKNSFDAHATEVKIIFNDLNTNAPYIQIIDNGKGMDLNDLKNKWLFVAYSAKKDKTEDIDYRNKIRSKFYYAGAKGIGRFSCDKLGEKLRLLTKKDAPNSSFEQLEVNWSLFEQAPKDQFVKINVQHRTLKESAFKYSTGTLLEISNLREESTWNYEKIIKLKQSLSKLINPFNDSSTKTFKIIIEANDFLERDNEVADENQKVNGLIENHLIKLLSNKTTKIVVKIEEGGKTISTEFSDNGNWLFSVRERNESYNLLSDILIELFYLNRSAKNNFTRLMGIKSGEYGSVFLYKNGIRIYPYGEPGEDPLSLDRRQQNRLGDYIGNSELIGRIEILNENEELIETTSRGNGLLKNATYDQLQTFFIEKVIVKLEGFRKHIIKYGIDIDSNQGNKIGLEQVVRLILDVPKDNELVNIEFNPNLLKILGKIQEDNESVKVLIKEIEKVAIDSDNEGLLTNIKKVTNTLNDALLIADLAEGDIIKKDKEVKEQHSQNLFLRSIKSQDFEEIISFMHHTGISSSIIDNYMTGLYQEIENGVSLNTEEIKRIFRLVIFENKKILNISKFATKANFKLYTDAIEMNLDSYIREYVQNIINLTTNINFQIIFENINNSPLTFKFRPIEINILIDNLISNSKKAKASSLKIVICRDVKNAYQMVFIDNGIGIPSNLVNKLFGLGYTTTSGSGVGLFHVKEIVERLNGSISVESEVNIGTKVIITLK